MNHNNICITILAGGLGKRMQSELPKVLHEVNGIPMIVRLLSEIECLNPSKIILVVGKFKDIIDKTIKQYIDFDKVNILYAMQDVPMGTGHAVLCTLDMLNDNDINLILNGDNPMLSLSVMKEALDNFVQNNNNLQITAIEANNPTGSGRIILNNNIFEKIVEEKDCSSEQKNIKMINCGIYVANSNTLKKYIPEIKNNNMQNEYYLTDIVEICKSNNSSVGLYVIDQSKEFETININTKEQLEILNAILSKK